MRKSFLSISLTALLSLNTSLVWSENISPEAILKIHEQVTTAFIAKCKEEMDGVTDEICNCLAQKTLNLLDDATLSLCTTDGSGNACVAAIINKAATEATSKENMLSCLEENNIPATLDLPSLETLDSMTPIPEMTALQ